MTRCEDRILKWLDFNLLAICPENFTTALLSFGIFFTDEGHAVDKAKSLRMYTEMFTDIALQSMELQKYKYSVQAVSAVVAARKAKNVLPEWNNRLE